MKSGAQGERAARPKRRAGRRPDAPKRTIRIPPRSDGWEFHELAYRVSHEQASAIAASVQLPLSRPIGTFADILSDIANRWLLTATRVELGGLPRQAPPSDRAIWCEGVVQVADELLYRLGAGLPEDARHPVAVRIRGDRRVTEIARHNKVRDALDNLLGITPSDLGEGAQLDADLEARRGAIELQFAPALSTATKPGQFGPSRRVDDDVLIASIAAIALVRDHAILSAAGWRARSAKMGRRGGPHRNVAQREAVRNLAIAFAWAFGRPLREQAISDDLVAFVDAFRKWMDAASPPHVRSMFGTDGPQGLTDGSIRRLAKEAAANLS